MDYRDHEYDRSDERYSGNKKLYCDLCFRRCRGIYHVIEKGDTLYSLGKRYHVSVSDLMRTNPYVNVYNLRIGEELCIPVRPRPRMDSDMDEDDWEDYMEDYTENMDQARERQWMNRMPDTMPERERTSMSENRRSEEYVNEEEIEDNHRTVMANRFSENDSIRDVLDKTGLTMSDFMEFLSKKMD